MDDDNDTIFEGRFFSCNNTVPIVGDDRDTVMPEYQVSDLVARMLAGAIGWSSNPTISDGTEMYMAYANTSEIRFSSTPSPNDMASQIASFTMGAISYMDDSAGMYRKAVAHGDQPINAQFLHVTWRYAGSILAVIPFIHFWTLMAVIFWANSAIIKDDSHLAIAKVYHTFLERLEDRGCLLRGDEIVTVLDNPMVSYGWTTSREEGYMHVDVFEQGGPIAKSDRPFVEGWYDGSSKKSKTAGLESEMVKRKQYRDIDAAEYF